MFFIQVRLLLIVKFKNSNDKSVVLLLYHIKLIFFDSIMLIITIKVEYIKLHGNKFAFEIRSYDELYCLFKAIFTLWNVWTNDATFTASANFSV